MSSSNNTCYFTEDFAFMFQSLKDAVFRLSEEEIRPEVLNCDAAFSIHNGFQKVFPDCNSIIMCWAHMRRAVAKNICRFLKSEARQNEFLCEFVLFKT